MPPTRPRRRVPLALTTPILIPAVWMRREDGPPVLVVVPIGRGFLSLLAEALRVQKEMRIKRIIARDWLGVTLKTRGWKDAYIVALKAHVGPRGSEGSAIAAGRAAGWRERLIALLEPLAFKGFTLRVGDYTHLTGRHPVDSYDERLVARMRLLTQRLRLGEGRGAARQAREEAVYDRLGRDIPLSLLREEAEKLKGLEKRERRRAGLRRREDAG